MKIKFWKPAVHPAFMPQIVARCPACGTTGVLVHMRYEDFSRRINCQCTRCGYAWHEVPLFLAEKAGNT